MQRGGSLASGSTQFEPIIMITVINTHLHDYCNCYTTLTKPRSTTSLRLALTGELHHSVSSYNSAAGLSSGGLITAKRLWDVALLFTTRLCLFVLRNRDPCFHGDYKNRINKEEVPKMQ